MDIVPSPEALKFDMPVKRRLPFDAGRQCDKDGNSYLSYFFSPAA